MRYMPDWMVIYMKKSTELNLVAKDVCKRETEAKRFFEKKKKMVAEITADKLLPRVVEIAEESAKQGKSKCNLPQKLFSDLYKSVYVRDELQRKLRKEGIMLQHENDMYSVDFRKWYERIGGHLLALICGGVLVPVIILYTDSLAQEAFMLCLFYLMMICGVLLVIDSEYLSGELEVKHIGTVICAISSCMIIFISLIALYFTVF